MNGDQVMETPGAPRKGERAPPRIDPALSTKNELLGFSRICGKLWTVVSGTE